MLPKWRKEKEKWGTNWAGEQIHFFLKNGVAFAYGTEDRWQHLVSAYNQGKYERQTGQCPEITESALQGFLPDTSCEEATLNLHGRNRQGRWQRWAKDRKSCLFSFNSGASILVTYATNFVQRPSFQTCRKTLSHNK